MPKTPITHREAFITEIRGSGQPPLLRRHDWNIVQTELGPMVEPASSIVPQVDQKVTQVDMTDAAFNTLSVITDADFNRRFGDTHNGSIALADYNA